MELAAPLRSPPVSAAAGGGRCGFGGGDGGGVQQQQQQQQQLNTIVEDSREAAGSLVDSCTALARPKNNNNSNYNSNDNNRHNASSRSNNKTRSRSLAAETLAGGDRKVKKSQLARRRVSPACGSSSADAADDDFPGSSSAPSSQPQLTQEPHEEERQEPEKSQSLSRPLDFDDLYDVTDESDRLSTSTSPDGDDTESDDDNNDNIRHHHHDRRHSEPLGRPSGNKYPHLLIPPPSESAGAGAATDKNSPVPPTPPPKIPISPAVLSRLPKIVPSVQDAPSLAGSNNSASSSANPSSVSAPPTPEMVPVQIPDWDEISNRTSGSSSITPQLDVQLDHTEDWSFILDRFPGVPTAEGRREEAAAASDSEQSQHSASVSSSSKGVRLPNAALDTLNGLDVDDRSSETSASPSVSRRLGPFNELDARSGLRRNSAGELQSAATTPTNATTAASAASYTPLSVPSPGGFFSSLRGDARRTWCINSPEPPSSGAAEKFYNRPWDTPGQTVVEHVVEAGYHRREGDRDDDDTNGPPTVKPVLSSGPPTARRLPPEAGTAADDSTLVDSLSQEVNELFEYDELYESELRFQASANLDRTSRWLAAQSAYLAALAETNPMNEVDGTRSAVHRACEDNSSVATSKKTVKILGTVPEEADKAENCPPTPKNTMFYRGFQHVRRRSRDRDAFDHGHFRFEATQAARVSLTEKHAHHLSGKYELTDPSRPPYRGPFSLAPRNSTEPQILADKAMFSKVEKEQDVLRQLYQSTWAIEALKYLNGGKLIPSPASKRLAKATSPLGTPESAGRHRRRVLDLGGHTACGWGWHVCSEYPNVKVYTVVPKLQAINPEIKGPANHRHVSIPQLWNLPLPANQVDLISARQFHMLLKSDRSVGGADEFDMCLRDCFRCLKPGGYLEFFVMDAEITRAGPYGSASSVEFAFNLKTRGYDPCPTRGFLSRLRKAGFMNLKRAWMFLPMGTAPSGVDEQQPAHTTKTAPCGSEEVGKARGSTSSIASATGLFAGWVWEQWMFKLQMEMGRDTDSFLQETATVIEEGRRTGAGWRCLSGWAMKPRTGNHSVPDQPPPLPPHRPAVQP